MGPLETGRDFMMGIRDPIQFHFYSKLQVQKVTTGLPYVPVIFIIPK
jgi:hypothetical protein